MWSVLRRWIRSRPGRMPPARLPDPIWYFAYGPNMNQRLFRERRHMKWLEAPRGFTVEHHEVTLYGRCSDCGRRGIRGSR